MARGGFFGMTGFSGLISLQIYHARRSMWRGIGGVVALEKEMEKGGGYLSAQYDIQCRHEASRERGLLALHIVQKEMAIIINMKTRCFHSIRFSLETFDKVEWTTGGLQFA